MRQQREVLATRWVLVAVLAAVLVAGGAVDRAWATTSGQQMDFQGYLTDDDGGPRNGTYRMVFEIYTALSAGTQVWNEVHDPVTVTDGVFSVRLGSVNSPLDYREDSGNTTKPVFDGSDRFLQIKIGPEVSEEPLTPRIQLTAAGYGLNAGPLALVAMSGDDWEVRNSAGTFQIYNVDDAVARVVVDAGGNVGIGVTSPDSPLEIVPSSYPTKFIDAPDSALSITGGIPDGGFARLTFGNGPQGNYAGLGAKVTGSGSYLYFGTSNNYSTGITNEALVIDPNGRVGIGTTSPGYRLDVVSPASSYGQRIVGGSTEFGLLIEAGSSANQAIINARDSGGNTKLFVRADGHTGIGGTTSPAARLHVADSQGTDFVARIDNTDTGSEADGLQITVGATNPGAGNDFIKFYGAGTPSVVGTVQGDGSGGVTYTSGSSDFAEYFTKLNPTETFLIGQIVFVVGNAVTADPASNWHTVGVVSEAPCVAGGKPFGRVTEAELDAIRRDVAAALDQEEPPPTRFADESEEDWNRRLEEEERHREDTIETRRRKACERLIRERTQANLTRHALVALLGRVPVSIQGHANTGDYIYYDGTAIPPDQITFEQYRKCVGKALESGEGQVLCLVGVR